MGRCASMPPMQLLPFSARAPALSIALTAGLLAPLLVAGAVPARGQEPRLEDRILAVVDGDPILASDVRRRVALGLATPAPEEDDHTLGRRVLDGLIEERLRLHEVNRLGLRDVAVSAIEDQMEEIRGRFPDADAFEERLLELGLDEEALAQIVARQLAVLRYVEERLGAQVFVTSDDVQSYYDEVLTPEMRRAGREPPPVEEVREEIRRVIREQRLTEEAEEWTLELRRKADVVDYYDRGSEELPPLKERFPADRRSPGTGSSSPAPSGDRPGSGRSSPC